MRFRHTQLIIWITIMMTLSSQESLSQDRNVYMRIAKITVDSARLPDYLVALKSQMESALKHEEGVLAYSAVQEKNNPARITIVETYASVAAYESHIQTDHFRKYKTAVADMVKQLELTEVIPIAIRSKLK